MDRNLINLARRLSLAALLATACVARAGAVPPSYEVAMVGSQGLDLRAQSGATALHHRVRVAVVKLCEASLNAQMPQSDVMVSCLNNSLRDAAAQETSVIAQAQGDHNYASAGK